VNNQASPSTVPNCCWPITNNTLTPDQQTYVGGGVAVGSAGIPVAYYGLFAIFASQKQHFYDSATEESVPPPPNQPKKPINRSNNNCAAPNYSLISSLRQTPERGGAHVSKCSPLCGGWGDTHQDTQCLRSMVQKRETNQVMRCC
jgi:hypothetical protein